jgi:uncharacterized protein
MLTIGVLASVAQGLGWDRMSEADRALVLEMWMPTPDQAAAQLALARGSYFEVVAHNASFVFMTQTFFFVAFFLWRCGGMMLLGMALFKAGFLDGSRPAHVYRTAAMVCLPLGLALAWYGVAQLERIRFAMPERTFFDMWNYAGAVLASVGYASVLLLMVKHQAFRGLRRALAAVGQMALTNYLLQSLIAAVFVGWGLGLGGRLDYAGQFIIVVSIWALQLAVSPIWLRQYRFGPAEWVWRSLTYWKRQPMRRETRRGATGVVARA